MLPYCIAWSYNEFICIILSGEASMEDGVKKKSIANITDMVTDYCSNNYTIGISNMHRGLEELKGSYNQAYNAYLTTRGANETNSRIAYYEKLGALQLLARLSGSAETEEFIENIMGRLIRYDKEKGTNMIQTLDIYLRTSSMKEASEMLYIHTKTMIFRKSRIEKILDLSLEDYEVRLSLSIALKLYSLH
jgi:sugar diacid utilization regulator